LLPIIQEAVVVGDRRNYCVAVIALDQEELDEWAKQVGIPADPSHGRVKEAIEAHVKKVNVGLASFEDIKYWRLLPEAMTVDNGLLTASLKVKRKVVEDRFADLIDDMYTSAKR
ncbi:MAG: long-chain fatty acid--CoA ligase, partial [Nannocystaceae bacterium]